MAKKSGIGFFLWTAASFGAGIAAGLLLAPRSGKESREIIKTNAEEALQWAEVKGQEIVTESEKKLHEVNENIKRKVKETVPDIYEATESLNMNDDDVIS